MFKGLLNDVKDFLKLLPGVGEKSAQRFTLYLVNHNKELAINLAKSLIEAVEKYQNCIHCGMLTIENPCEFCDSISRDGSVICIVENTSDVFLIESTNCFKGKYFVLENLLSPLEGIGPEDLRISELDDLVKKRGVREIILALNPSPEGETTIDYIANVFNDKDITLTRLSTGIPFGSDIGYTSAMTLSNAINRRYRV